MLRTVQRYQPDYLLGIGSFRAAHAAWLLRKASYVFTDTEHATEQIPLFKPFASKIVTPTCFTTDFGHKHVRYNGYHELAYLHPDRFRPNPEVLAEIGLTTRDSFFILRFVSWEATHDIGHKGFSLEGKRRLIRLLQPHGKIIITSESPLSEEFEPYRLPISPVKIHDLLYYATMYIGEGGTMASEAAVLGTPSIFVNTLTAGTFRELEQKYGLLKTFPYEQEAFSSTRHFLKNNDLKMEWIAKRQNMLMDTIDVTQWIMEYMLNGV
jgi:predicted glycosyltransferase